MKQRLETSPIPSSPSALKCAPALLGGRHPLTVPPTSKAVGRCTFSGGPFTTKYNTVWVVADPFGCASDRDRFRSAGSTLPFLSVPPYLVSVFYVSADLVLLRDGEDVVMFAVNQ
ncbi:hypothetical protein CABS01_02427 [Colletotrichum abscissum]|uniref:Uncharacterized protein n=1 Tax=Colletotrichum abscissum TaxID=1671311 RepID=A0A9Q0B8C2_9PEZI|nr:uncharacterized protein CABS01_02427 [Colletotrichum abscissum]KAI3559190.1 hypothetical protein CABS02_00165 [Colletotrichum abscissum]KAK1488797.1 hypothetical protein CABS01_02427 [Colletotrichum abscissum]